MAAEGLYNRTMSYSVHSCSSHSGNFVPENIREDLPRDSSSRWCSNSIQPPQYILLKLDQLSLLKSITFGKYEQPHVCNVKNLQVYCGLDHDHMTLVLDECLANDCSAETFPISYTISDHEVPARFVKIVPLRTYGNNSFNFSLWFVRLEGFDDSARVLAAHQWLTEHREREAVRLCMKHLRQSSYTEAFQCLQKRSKVDLEDPRLTRLHDCVVAKGDFESCEQIMSEAAEQGLLDDFVAKQPVQVHWTRVQSRSTTGEGSQEVVKMQPDRNEGSSPCHGNQRDVWPGMRGGHAMCVDPTNETLYLMGGYSGSKELADFWSYDTRATKWTLLSLDTAAQGGPSARSCHKMVFDSKHRKLYCLGYYSDISPRTAPFTAFPVKSDFFCFDVVTGSWSKLAGSTLALGGPPPVFDHQMCVDEERQLIFVFGGKTQSKQILLAGHHGDESVSLKRNFSGLYVYNIATSDWRRLRKDGSGEEEGQIVGRAAHTMVYHPERQELFIMGGQRNKENLHPLLVYHVPSDTITAKEELKSTRGDMCGFALRAVLDPFRNEIHIYTGLHTKREPSNPDQLQASLWVYDIPTSAVTCVHRHELMGSSYWLLSLARNTLPCPRYGHQFAYDPFHQVHYLFGGNPGNNKQPSMRLDDLWILKMSRATREQVLKKSVFMIRRHKFEEKVKDDPVAAIHFLQTSLSAIVDHDNQEEEEEFRSLATRLFSTDAHRPGSEPEQCSRSKLYDRLSRCFPPSMSQPNTDLRDLIT